MQLLLASLALAACADSEQGVPRDMGGGTCVETDRTALESVPEDEWTLGLSTALAEYEAAVGVSLSGTVSCHSDIVPDGPGSLELAAVCARADMELVSYGGDDCPSEGVDMGIECAGTTFALDDWFVDVGLAPKVDLFTSIGVDHYWARAEATESTPGIDVNGWDHELHVEVEIPPTSDETESGTLPGGVGWESRKEATRCILEP